METNTQTALADKDYSVLSLLMANMIPLFGVLLLGWDLFYILLLYWLESAVIGFFNVLKMQVVGGVKAVFLSGFFTLHYGIFMLVHLVFIIAMFGPGGGMNNSKELPWQQLPQIVVDLLPAFAFLIISHTVSFITNFLGKQEFTRLTADSLMAQPYKRIIVMHLTILLGGFLVQAIGAPVIALVFMIVLKTFIDLSAHKKQHEFVPAS